MIMSRESWKEVGFNLLSLAVVFTCWEIFARWMNSPYFPGFKEIVIAFVSLMRHGDVEGITLAEHILASIIRILAGFGAACVMAIPLGLAMGLYPHIYKGTRAVVEPVRFIPPIAWIPVAIVLLVGFSRYAFLIWLGAFFPIFINVLVGVPRVNPIHVNVTRIFGAKRWYIIRKIVIPSVAPDIASGMRVGLGIAWMCIVAAEMIGGEMVGIGRLILKYAELIRMAEIIVGMLMIGLIGFLMNEVFIRVEKRLFRWRWEVSLD
ncbi:MAG: ABC transporter permease [Deltaproteobacteria bacterium]|nr:ABC transporter permease [Deltaproteobacteria bacterium]MBW2308366.1 ABC transporter permease [Deltaproteobacteria bacterium]